MVLSDDYNRLSRKQLIERLEEAELQQTKKETECQELRQRIDRLQSSDLPIHGWRFSYKTHQYTSISSIYDSKRRLLSVSTRKARLSSAGAEEMIGRRDEELIPSDICNKYLPTLKLVYQTKQPQSLELKLTEQYGETMHLVQYLPVFDDHGEILQVLAISTDITRQKQVESSLRESSERLQIAMEAAQLGTWDYNLRSKDVFWDNRSRQIFGVSSVEEMDLSKFMAFVHPEDRDLVKKALKKGIDPAEGKGGVEFRIIRRDGEIRWIYASGRVYFEQQEEARKAVHIIGTNMDITERKRAEEKLKENELKFQSLFDNSSDPIFIHDFHGHILEVNAMACERLGYTRNELLQMTLADIDSPEHAPLVSERLREIEQNGQTVFESIHRRKDGPDIPVEVHSRVIEYVNETCILSVARDITKRKEAENALLQFSQTLEKKVVERTKLAESHLKEVQSLGIELLKAEERERKRIAQILHDDLQQLLVGARMHLDTLHRENEPAISKVDHLLEESIEKSRDLSHELSPPMVYHTGLADVLNGLARKMMKQFGLKVELEAETDFLLRNETIKIFLFRALQEMLFNVVKHARVPRARIILSNTADHILLSVSDSGQGFDPAQLEHAHSGAGLGLLTLREKARSIGCSLKIESSPGQGSCFTLKVPFHLTKADSQV